jgi:predicted transcriptional regulator
MLSYEEILLSLKPKHALQIFGGGKTVELRKRKPNLAPGTRVWIYATAPSAELKGYARLVRIETGSPEFIWNTLGSWTGISKSEFDSYFHSRKIAHALILTDVMEMKRALPLEDIRKKISEFQPPQFFCRLNGARESLRLNARKYRKVPPIRRRSTV